MQKSYRATRHQWQFPQFAAAAFKFNSTSIQTHVVAATIQRNTEYRIWRNTESEEYLQTRERAMKQSTVIIKFNLTSIWCHVAVLRTKTRYRISNHMYCENQSVVLQSSRIPQRRNEGRGATLKFTSLPSAPPDATEMLWEVLNRSNLKQGIQNTKARSECTTVYEQNTSL